VIANGQQEGDRAVAALPANLLNLTNRSTRGIYHDGINSARRRLAPPRQFQSSNGRRANGKAGAGDDNFGASAQACPGPASLSRSRRRWMERLHGRAFVVDGPADGPAAKA